MRIAMVTIALRLPSDPSQWISVPPQGYAGIHWVVANLIDGLLDLGHEVFLLGAPGSAADRPGLTVVDAAEIDDIHAWLATAAVDVVHDHSCGQLDPHRLPAGLPRLSTHHLTGRPKDPHNAVYVSRAQRAMAGSHDAPVIRIAVNSKHYEFSRTKEPYLLFLGRVSTFKGTYEAAAFAHAAGRPLVVAGPSWEEDYRHRIATDFGSTVDFVGVVGGQRRRDLLSRASAIMVLSQPVMGPWGDIWCEPGSTVVSEAAASGTPVISTSNGCLPEIVPSVGVLVPDGAAFSPDQARQVLAQLPDPQRVRHEALTRWGYLEKAREYLAVYHRVCAGEGWT
jgi:glycosyltransferase involved in cell wall biosynthesis